MLPLTDEKIIELIYAESSVAGEKCPPHNFVPSWALPRPGSTDDDHETVPAMLCSLCGDVRAMQL